MPCPAKIELPKTPGEFKLNLLSPTNLPPSINNKLSGIERIRLLLTITKIWMYKMYSEQNVKL